MKLELLENRTLLSNVTVAFNPSTSALTITGDTSNDNFVITEQSNGSVTVAPGALKSVTGVGIVPGSTIDGSSSPFNTGNPVSTINVTLPGTSNFDFLQLLGQGKTSLTTVKNVTISATGAALGTAASPGLLVSTTTTNGVDNAGSLVVTDTFTSPTNAVVSANISNSTFSSVSVLQTGGGPDASFVTMGNDAVAGTVAVSLGNANGDGITLNPSNVFGSTTLLEGNGGPSNSSSLGNSDTVLVTGPGTYKTLNVDQILNGTKDSIKILGTVPSSPIIISALVSTTPTVVDGVSVLQNGVFTMQANGAGDLTQITGVNTGTAALPGVNLPLPTGIGFASITVVQGNGSVGLPSPIPVGTNDVASVTTSTVPGNISITQTDLASNTPSVNTATISGDTAGFSNSKGSNAGTIKISQGNAGGTLLLPSMVTTPGDSALVTSSTSFGSTTITQGTGSKDTATVSLSTVGGGITITQSDVVANPAGDTALVMTDTVTGNVTITQGEANGDVATIDPTTITGNVVITQLDGNGDSASVLAGSVGGNITISQGTGNSDSATVDTPTIGGSVSITQTNGNSDFAIVEIADVGGNITITQGNGNGDSATIFDIVSTFTPPAMGGPTSVTYSIKQGSGAGDTALIEDVLLTYGNVSISQSDAGFNAPDTAEVINVTTGTSSGGADVDGTVTITQGNAGGDVALVQGGSSNNISITQGNNLSNFDGSTQVMDIAEVNDTTVFSDISIIQGTAGSTAGGYVAAIAEDYLGDFGSGSVSASATLIDQQGANNQVFLGDIGGADSFTTVFLDVFTGAGGGAFVIATNTIVFFGPLGYFSPVYTIEGGGSGNTFVDNGGNYGVLADPSNFNS
jgi:hypothetical protein